MPIVYMEIGCRIDLLSGDDVKELGIELLPPPSNSNINNIFWKIFKKILDLFYASLIAIVSGKIFIL